MSGFRFEVGDEVMCNMGAKGWKLGRIIALLYREDHWPAHKVAPYQVALEADRSLIYVPEDKDVYCREPRAEDLRIARRMDALAAFPFEEGPEGQGKNVSDGENLSCADGPLKPGHASYRSGRCHCCDSCPRNWSAVELYSEHYRCAARNGLKVTRHSVNLGRVRVGESVKLTPEDTWPSKVGFMQCPTLVRLPPGLLFSDDGALNGEIHFDPHRGERYQVDFVAVSTADWNKTEIGLTRLEISMMVEGNEPPRDFDFAGFRQEQEQARAEATRCLHRLYETWEQWERDEKRNSETCEEMLEELRRLRDLLEEHPRLDGGRWWAQLGGFHMNVHKLLENALFECELYLGHALTFGDPELRQMAEQNLEGCYQKRLLEAARFMWIDGLEQMMRGDWARAAETLREAAAKKDGWGWAVNFGDIWFSEAAARLAHGAGLVASEESAAEDGERWIIEAEHALGRGVARTAETGAFGSKGHPWAVELEAALTSYRRLRESSADINDWLKAFQLRTVYWCAQVLGGASPFPPKPRPRGEDAAALVSRLPGHNDLSF